MRAQLARLVAALRARGVAVSVAEAIDAAAATAVAGVERERLREALAATLVKDERDRPLFDEAFERVFPGRVEGGEGRGGRRRRPGGGAGETGEGAGGAAAGRGRAAGGRIGEPREAGEAAGAGEAGEAAGAGEAGGAAGKLAPAAAAAARARLREPREARRAAGFGGEAEERPAERPAEPGEGGVREAAAGETRAGEAEAAREERAGRGAGAAADAGERARLLARRLRVSPRVVEEAAELVRALARRFKARLRRRLRPRARGRLDFRRTIRAAVPRGGALVERHWRGRRPGKIALVALCDLSASAAAATDFFLAMLAPAAEHFARVRLYGYVDRLVEIDFADGQVRPAGPIDLMARSDFGRVLVDFTAGPAADLTADTVLLVLGDARNNRRPPRADLLAAARARVRRLLWLDPEPLERWNTGDSVIAAYAPHCDAVVPCGSLAELDRALAVVARL